MLLKSLFSCAAIACVGVISLAGQSSPASAKGCYYKAVKDGRVIVGIRGVGHAAKKSWACNRARRKCNRRLERDFKFWRHLPRGATPRNTHCKKSA